MSTYWKTLLREVLDDTHKYSDVIHTIYCIIQDYHENGTDHICGEDTLKELRRSICYSDPEWALLEIDDAQRCVRCRNVFIKDDLTSVCVKHDQHSKKANRELACESCYRRIYDMGLYASDSDTESSSEDEQSDDEYEQEYLSRAEFDDEMARGR